MPAIRDASTVAVSGASGLVGAAVVPALEQQGHTVRRLVRHEPAGENEIYWDSESQSIDAAKLQAVDAVIHLAGESIAQGRWTEDKKRRIRDSRVQGTQRIAQTLAASASPPRLFVCASAIGFYGDRGADQMDETAEAGEGFLAEVCQAWEAATRPAADAGIRTVNLRTGVVVSPEGGALAKMLTPFKMGLGGPLGSGKQYMSWISRQDVVRAILFILAHDQLQGPVNLVAPNPVTNREWTKTLGRVLGRPAVLPMPAFAARLAFGEMADEMLLASTRVIPARLTEAGFSFEHSRLEATLEEMLGK